jgi:hypothetical protein
LVATVEPDLFAPTPSGGHLIGYARTSRRNQNLDRQISALTAEGCQRIYRDQLSGKDADRPGLTKALDHLLEGDTLVVTELSRLGRSLQDLITIVADLRRRNVGFGLCTNSSTPPLQAGGWSSTCSPPWPNSSGSSSSRAPRRASTPPAPEANGWADPRS